MFLHFYSGDEIEVQQPVEQLPQKKNKKKKQKAKKIAQSPVQEGKDKKAGGGQTPKVQSPQVNVNAFNAAICDFSSI